MSFWKLVSAITLSIVLGSVITYIGYEIRVEALRVASEKLDQLEKKREAELAKAKRESEKAILEAKERKEAEEVMVFWERAQKERQDLLAELEETLPDDVKREATEAGLPIDAFYKHQFYPVWLNSRNEYVATLNTWRKSSAKLQEARDELDRWMKDNPRPETPKQSFKKWSSKFSTTVIEAKLLGTDGETAWLQKPDGKKLPVKVSDLHAGDAYECKRLARDFAPVIAWKADIDALERKVADIDKNVGRKPNSPMSIKEMLRHSQWVVPPRTNLARPMSLDMEPSK